MITRRRLAIPSLAALALAGCHASTDDSGGLTANEEAQLNEAAATLDAQGAAPRNVEDAGNAGEADTGNDTEQTS